MAILEVQRSTLIFAPTIDLMNQWYNLLSKAFAINVGLLGGGYHEIEDVTIATYDSAYMHMERLGNRFGMIVFDEVRHLPGEMYSHAAEKCIAPRTNRRPPHAASARSSAPWLTNPAFANCRANTPHNTAGSAAKSRL